jgi:hypothetical protein
MKLRFADVLSTPEERRASQLTRICAAAYTEGMARGTVPNLSPDRRYELTCFFSALRNSERIVLRNELAFALRDATPGSDLHTWSCHFGMRGLTSTSPQKDLRRRLTCWAAGRTTIPSGSFRGRFHRANVGLASGDTIFHCHIDLSPGARETSTTPWPYFTASSRT